MNIKMRMATKEQQDNLDRVWKEMKQQMIGMAKEHAAHKNTSIDFDDFDVDIGDLVVYYVNTSKNKREIVGKIEFTVEDLDNMDDWRKKNLN